MPNPNTAVFPTGVATDSDLPVATGSFSTSLTADINFSTATIPVNSVSADVPVLLRIENEIILAVSKGASDFTSCVRGFAGTTATAHSAGVQVFGYIFAHHYNQLAAEIKAIEDALGANMANVVLSANPQFDLPQYIYYRAAVTQSGSASLAFSTVTATKPTPGSVEGTHNTFGVVDFVKAAGEKVWEHFAIPEDFKTDSAIEVELRWISTNTSGNVNWQIDAAAVTLDAPMDIASWTYTGNVTETVPGTAGDLMKSVITISTTGDVIAGDEFVFQIQRGSDTAVDPARLIGVQFKLTRALNQQAQPN